MEKERFQLKHFFLFEFILKPAIYNFSKMFYIGKSLRLEETLLLTNKKLQKNDITLCLYLNFYIRVKILLENTLPINQKRKKTVQKMAHLKKQSFHDTQSKCP